MFGNAIFFCLCMLIGFNGVFGVDTDGLKSVSVMEGDSVTLHTDLTEIQRDDLIVWMFGPNETQIAHIIKQFSLSFIDDGDDGRFRDKLQLDYQTGSLIIRNITIKHSGLYKLQIISNRGTSYKRFSVTVYAPLPVPAITNNSSVCSSSSSERSSLSKCVLVCSVVNVTQVTLSWYKGNSLFSSISVSDLNSSHSLPLEVEYQENNIYSCVVSNHIRNQTKHLNITEVCQMCSAPLPVPAITNNCSSSERSSLSKCVLVCSVVNVTQVTLSWYKGNSLFSSISVSDLNSSHSLPLEVEYQENNIYSCVVSNPIRNQTKHLNITEVCQMCSGDLFRVIASVIPAVLLAVLAVGMFILYKKHRRTGQKGNYFESPVHAAEPVQTEEEEVQYAETTFYKRVQNKMANGTEETIYISVIT
ncbi:uncharacterized protein LOC127438826 isoform X1 [Myxocyprinus asiaticus]|uniref:uncharacterized protein LOC127438826 isoform X1 n=1 Tax=Myxocyprinus asiaticus TaxID=70543 RepID=UPI002222067F|nr:uncharacterized protein LOC127438826 isoform X1 [Myxocyprinus asiaticus]